MKMQILHISFAQKCGHQSTSKKHPKENCTMFEWNLMKKVLKIRRIAFLRDEDRRLLYLKLFASNVRSACIRKYSKVSKWHFRVDTLEVKWHFENYVCEILAFCKYICYIFYNRNCEKYKLQINLSVIIMEFRCLTG